jgi:hypothetical protein
VDAPASVIHVSKTKSIAPEKNANKQEEVPGKRSGTKTIQLIARSNWKAKMHGVNGDHHMNISEITESHVLSM